LYKKEVTSDLKNYYGKIGQETIEGWNTPCLLATGWWDHCMTGPVDLFKEIQLKGSEYQKKNTHLLIGPWEHSMDPVNTEEYDFGPEENGNHTERDLQFFDRHLKNDKSNPDLPPVRIFTIGRNQWRDEEEWPLSRAVYTPYFLHSEGQANGLDGNGTISLDPPNNEKRDEFEYDPGNPVPSWGGANAAPSRYLPMKKGARNQFQTLNRQDVLVYISNPLSEPLEVTGPLKMILYAASSAVDTDFTAKLMERNSESDDWMIIHDGVVRARYRIGRQNPVFLKPEEIVCYEIDLWYTSIEFKRGNQIAVAISSSNFPRLPRNLNTGNDNERSSKYITAQQAIYHDSEHPSHLLLPIIQN